MLPKKAPLSVVFFTKESVEKMAKQEKAEREARERVVTEQHARLEELLGEARAWKDAALAGVFVDARRRHGR